MPLAEREEEEEEVRREGKVDPWEDWERELLMDDG